MYAILEISGRQEKVEKGSKLYINRLDKKEGQVIKISKVLFAKKGNQYHIGTPYIKGASVDFEVLSHPRGKKVIAFKFKRRKSYRKIRGHRQDLTYLKVNDINI